MSVHTLHIDDFSNENYKLIGIHTRIENYQLAFLINQYLQVKLKRADYNLDFGAKKHNSSYAVYEYTDKKYDYNWFLIENICRIQTTSNGLFGETEQTHYLLPEEKKVDYFLKLEGDFENEYLKKCTDSIKNIPQIVTSYLIEVNKLKSKEFLIF